MNRRVIFYTVFAGFATAGAARSEPVIPGSPAWPERRLVEAASVEQLKRDYLECDRRASRSLLGFGDAAHCSLVHEALKERAFGGDFERMLAWWKSGKLASATLQRD